jgi:hypothetical protein
MISIQNHDVGSTAIDVVNVSKIIAKAAFTADAPETCYREIQIIDDQHRVITLNLYAGTLDKLEIVEEKRKTHEWGYACNTPAGGLAGDEEIYVCIHCGQETNDTDKESLNCPTPDKDVQCPDCKPHPKHKKGKCIFACWCKTDNEPEGANIH